MVWQGDLSQGPDRCNEEGHGIIPAKQDEAALVHIKAGTVQNRNTRTRTNTHAHTLLGERRKGTCSFPG